MLELNNVSLSELWNTPSVHKRSTLGFWWWFFILVLKDPPGNFPRQLMTLWATKDVKTTIINNRKHTHEVGIQRSPEKDTFKGVLGAWYYDGSTMHHDLVLDNAYCQVSRNPNPGIFINGRSQCSLTPNSHGLNFDLTSPRLQLSTDWRLHQDIPYFAPISEQKKYLNGLIEQHTFKINKFDFSGKLGFNQQTENIEGVGYLQRIVLNSPVPPWWWGVLFFENGSMLKYFLPNISLAVFRRTLRDHPTATEVAFKAIKKELDFYDQERGEIYSFKKAFVRKFFKSNGLQTFHFRYKGDNGSLEYYLDCYSRSYFAMKGKVFETPLQSTLYYNEYPCMVRKFRMDVPGRHITQDMLGKGVGNCEHSWGIML